MSSSAGADGPVERYLDELATQARTLPVRAARHLLAETEAHLRDAVADAVSAGVPEQQAERQAVERFGPVRELVRAERVVAMPLRVIAAQVVRTAVLLGGIGAVAVGVSGLVAAIVRAVGGDGAVAAVAPGRTLSASDCARWLGLHPSRLSCRAAAVADWADETVWYRIAAGLLGVVALVVARALVRRAGTARALLDPRVSDTIAVTAFGAAAVWTAGMGIDAVVVDAGRGSGQWFSATPVALAAAVWFAIRLVRSLRGQEAVPA